MGVLALTHVCVTDRERVCSCSSVKCLRVQVPRVCECGESECSVFVCVCVCEREREIES